MNWDADLKSENLVILSSLHLVILSSIFKGTVRYE